jgi:hypothetical protein
MEQQNYRTLFVLQIRHRFGCYDEITEVDRRRVRHCNWVRFLRAASTYSDEVNMIGTKVKGKTRLNVSAVTCRKQTHCNKISIA